MCLRRFFCFWVVIVCPVSIFAQDNLFKGRMFSDLEVTNSITKSYRDSVYVFRVKVMDDSESPQISKRYYWFYQGEVKNTVGNYTGKLLHGSFEKFDRKEALLEKGAFAYGLKDGDWLTWYANGNVATKRHWDEGIRDGDFADYNVNGQTLRKGAYRNGKLHGKVYYYANDGTIEHTDRYRNGAVRKPKPKKAKVAKNGEKMSVTEKQKKVKNKSTDGKERRGFFRKNKKDKSVESAVQEVSIPPGSGIQPSNSDDSITREKKRRRRSDEKLQKKPIDPGLNKKP